MKRVEALDVWRSLCVFGMMVYHAIYDLALFGRLDGAVLRTLPVQALHWSVAAGFILISGIAARFSRGGLRRGFAVFCTGLAVTLATTWVGLPVCFGILHFLGAAMMLCARLRPTLFPEERGPRPWQPALFLALFALTAVWTGHVTVPARWLYPLGFRYAGFYSADYYPLLPWIFLYALGAWLGGVILVHRDSRLFTRCFPLPLTFAGRHSLLIYLLHQPVLYGLCRLLFQGTR